MLFRGKKGNFGALLFIGVLLFNFVMYWLVWSANADPIVGSLGNGGLPETDLDTSNAYSWFDGFRISIWGLPEWLDYLYFTGQGVLIFLALYMLFKGMH